MYQIIVINAPNESILNGSKDPEVSEPFHDFAGEGLYENTERVACVLDKFLKIRLIFLHSPVFEELLEGFLGINVLSNPVQLHSLQEIIAELDDCQPFSHYLHESLVGVGLLEHRHVLREVFGNVSFVGRQLVFVCLNQYVKVVLVEKKNVGFSAELSHESPIGHLSPFPEFLLQLLQSHLSPQRELCRQEWSFSLFHVLSHF